MRGATMPHRPRDLGIATEEVAGRQPLNRRHLRASGRRRRRCSWSSAGSRRCEAHRSGASGGSACA